MHIRSLFALVTCLIHAANMPRTLASTQQRVAFDSSLVSSLIGNIGCVMAEVWPPLMAIASAFESDFLVEEAGAGKEAKDISVGGGVAAKTGSDDNATAHFLYSNFRSLSKHFVMGFVGFENDKFIGYHRGRNDITWPNFVYMRDENSSCDFEPYNLKQLCRRSYANTTNRVNGRANGPASSMKSYATRFRPWYMGTKADTTTGTYWSSIYSFATAGVLGMTAGVQLIDSQGKFLGVAGLDYKLSELEAVLQIESYYDDDGIRGGDTTTTFLVDSAGFLVGSSISNVSFVHGAQVFATRARHKIIRSASELYTQQFGWSDNSVKTITIEGSLYFSQCILHTDDHGLSWFVVVVQRVLCPTGYRVENETASCVECFYPYTSAGLAESTDQCSLCAENFYMSIDGLCKRCKKKNGMDCGGDIGFTTESLRVNPGFYRLTSGAEEVYECPIAEHCAGNSTCSVSSTGALCSTCNLNYFFDQGKGRCAECDGRVAMKVVQSTAIFIGILLAATLISKFQPWFRGKLSNSETVAFKILHSVLGLLTSSAFLSRGKILWTAYQVVAATKQTLPTISFPKLFYLIRDTLGNFVEFRLIQLPGTEIQCFMGGSYNHYTQLIGVTLFPVFAYGIIALGLLCAQRQSPEGKAAGFWSALLLVSYLTLPNVSEICFSMFDCVEFVESNDQTRRFLAIDHSISCDAGNQELRLARAYASIAMLSPLGGPVGTPLLCAWLLWMNRHKIRSPLGGDKKRHQDPHLSHLKWIFASYRCECWWFETFEIVRRVLLTGALVLIPLDYIEIRLMVAIVLAFASVVVQESTRPYQDFATNALALCSHIVILGLFFLGSQINCGVIAGEFLLAALICIPLLFPIAIMIYLQWSEENRQRHKRLLDSESEVQKDEIKAQLRQILLAEERLLSSIHLRDRGGQESRDKMVHKHTRRSLIHRQGSNISSVSDDVAFMRRLEFREESLVKPRFDHHGKYPCYVMDLDVILNLDTLPAHEEALRLNMLQVLTRDSEEPNSAHTFFISQNWEGDSVSGELHPDNEHKTKLGFLKNLREHLSIGEHRTWIWFDIFSIPQADRKKQLLAIDSIQYYSATISRFVPLVRDEKQWRDAFQTEPSRMFAGGPVRGALSTYQSRGWCRLEVFCALCPKRFKDGSWRPGPIGLRYYYHTAPPDVGGSSMGPALEAASLLDPLAHGIEYTCCWRARKNNEAEHICDRPKIKKIIGEVACQYIDYCRSGSTVWDTTLNMRDLPEWIYDAARAAQEAAAGTKTASWHRRLRSSCMAITAGSAKVGVNMGVNNEGNDHPGNSAHVAVAAVDVEQQQQKGSMEAALDGPAFQLNAFEESTGRIKLPPLPGLGADQSAEC